MKNFLKLYIFLFFILIIKINITSKIHYNGVIEFYIRPYYEDLEKQFFDSRGLIDTTKNIPSKIYSNFEMPFYGEGFSIIPNKTNGINVQYKIAKQILQNRMSGADGVYAYYKGNSCLSDSNGRILFPNFEESKEIYLIITDSIRPDFSRGNIPTNFKIDNNATAKGFRLTENREIVKIDGKEEEKIFWNIEPYNIISGNIIPINSIIVFSNSEYLTIDQNHMFFKESQNMILPDLLILPNFSSNILALEALEFTNQFSKIEERSANVLIGDVIHDVTRFTGSIKYSGN